MRTWRRRCGAGWIGGADAAALGDAFLAFAETRARHPGPVRVQIADTDPARLLAAFFAAVGDDDPVDVFLTPPHGTGAELEAIEAAVEPDLFWTRGELVSCGRQRPERPGRSQARVMIPTGGTTAGLRFAVHTWRTLEGAAAGVQAWLGGGPVDSLCLLPLHHVSGLMQAVRAYVSGGVLTLAEWPQVGEGRFPPHGAQPGVTSLVPTQLMRVLDQPGGAAWLRGFRCIFLGGAPAWPELLARARAEAIPLAPCYGMTETAAQVATLRPEAFLAGAAGVGAALPHASLEIRDEKGEGPVPSGTAGRIIVRGRSLFCGYHPDADDRPVESFDSSDRGILDAQGYLTVLGRTDALINTGGEKVDPLEVEAAIRALGCARDVTVLGIPDREWGERVVAVLAGCDVDDRDLRERLKAGLAAHKIPKRFLRVAYLPRNDAGKLDRRGLRDLVAADEKDVHPR